MSLLNYQHFNAALLYKRRGDAMSEVKVNHSQRFGIILVLSCGIMWGVSGVLGQYVFQSSDVNAVQLSIIRQFISGVVLLIIAAIKRDKKALSIWSKPKSIISMLFFALAGVMGVQFTYFASIEHSNAATGTVIQFTYIIMILLFTTIFMHKKPHSYEALSVICAFVGIFLIATHGSLNSLAISRPALTWGLTSAVCFTIYCLYPQKLYNEYGLINVIGWSSLIAAIFLAVITRTFSLPHMNARIIAASLAVAVVGSLIPFTIYGLGISILGSVKASLFVTVEPVSSALLTWIFLGTRFTRMDMIGFLLILGSIQVVAVMTFRNERHIVKAEQTHIS